jgi:hypothetical protein
MEITKHAQTRIQQRGISNMVLQIIENYGRVSYAPGGAEKIFFGKRECNRTINELKKAISLVERARGGSMIIANGQVVTVYKS